MNRAFWAGTNAKSKDTKHTGVLTLCESPCRTVGSFSKTSMEENHHWENGWLPVNPLRENVTPKAAASRILPSMEATSQIYWPSVSEIGQAIDSGKAPLQGYPGRNGRMQMWRPRNSLAIYILECEMTRGATWTWKASSSVCMHIYA